MANLREWKFSEAQRCVAPQNTIVSRTAVYGPTRIGGSVCRWLQCPDRAAALPDNDGGLHCAELPYMHMRTVLVTTAVITLVIDILSLPRGGEATSFVGGLVSMLVGQAPPTRRTPRPAKANLVCVDNGVVIKTDDELSRTDIVCGYVICVVQRVQWGCWAPTREHVTVSIKWYFEDLGHPESMDTQTVWEGMARAIRREADPHYADIPQLLDKGVCSATDVLWMGVLHNISTIGLFAVVVVLGRLQMQQVVARMRSARRSCPHCGYPQIGLQSAICPECGQTILPPK